MQAEATLKNAVEIPDGQTIVGQAAVGAGEYWAGVIVSRQHEGYCIHFVRGAPAAGEQRVRVWYCDKQKGLVSCEGRVSPIEGTEEKLGHLLLSSLAPVAALGRRSTPRVSLPGPGVPGVLGQGIKCRVVDISAGGIGVIVSDVMSVGCVVRVAFECAGQMITGPARVVNRRRLADGQYRCGLQAMETEVELKRRLRNAAMTVEEQQLRQIARAVDRKAGRRA